MKRVTVLALVATLATAAACKPGASSPSPPARPSATSPQQPSPQGYVQPDDLNDPLLTSYCFAQDEVITLEGKLLSEKMTTGAMVSSMLKAQAEASRAARYFMHNAPPELARRMQAWADSFDLVIQRLKNGARPIDALRPAIVALANIERMFTCEIDA